MALLLVIDDDPLILECFRVLFEKRGDERARLDVTNADDRTLNRHSRGSHLAHSPRRAPATLRHGPRQSVP